MVEPRIDPHPSTALRAARRAYRTRAVPLLAAPACVKRGKLRCCGKSVKQFDLCGQYIVDHPKPVRRIADDGEGHTMQRPVMNPTFTYDKAKKTPKPPSRYAWVFKIFKLFTKLLMAHPFGNRQFRNEDGSRFGRIFRGLTYRLAFVPVLLVGFIVAILFAATHPARSGSGADPLAYG